MTPYINPLRFIHRRTPKGIRFLLTDPSDSTTTHTGAIARATFQECTAVSAATTV